MALSWTYLAASMAAMLLCCYFGSRDTSPRLCEWHEFSTEVAETAKYLGSKTPYPLLQHIQGRAHVQVKRNLTGCQAVQVYAIIRHGTRYATEKRNAETQKLKAVILRKLGSKLLQDSLNLSLHSNPVPHHDHGDLTHLGMREQYCLALRLKSSLPSLLTVPYSKQHYTFRSSQTSRSFKSALSFAAGLFKDEGPLDGYQPVDIEVRPVEEDNLLRFDEHDCPLYDHHIPNNKTLKDEFEKLLDSATVEAISEHVQNHLDPERVLLNITTDDILTLYKLCVDETALHLRPSYWCQLLSPTHLATLHRYHDYKTLWKKGGGQPITALRSVHLVKDIIDFFTSDTSAKVAFRFGHSETLLPLLTFLDLPLNKFDTSSITPFSANALFILYTCSSATNSVSQRLFVSLLVNEVPVEMNLCPEEARRERNGLCPLDSLEAAASLKTSNWKPMKELCSLPSG